MAAGSISIKSNIVTDNQHNSDMQMSLSDDSFLAKKHDAFQEMCFTFECDSSQSAWPDCFGQGLISFLKNEAPIPTLSLFSGAGGLDIGFNDAGFNILECVEIERKFCDTLLLNSGKGKTFSHEKVNCIDIREYIPSDLPQIDFIIGGSPCQTFSAAGRRANGVLGTTGDKGVLYKEYARLISKLEPRGFLFENVYGITGAQNGSAWQEILNEFSNTGYKLFYRILDAADYGVPQHRERLFIIGLKEGSYLFPRPTHGPDSPQIKYYSAEQAISSVRLTDKEAEEGLNGRYGHLLNDIPPGLNYSFYTEQMGHPNPVFAWRSKFSDFLYKADPCTPVRTIKAQGGQYTGPFHWNNRSFSIAEHKRLQTFPDKYELSWNKQTQLHQIGNAVPPQLARILALSIRNQVFSTDFGFDIPYLNESEELGFRKRKRLLTKQYQEKAKLAISKLQNNIVKISPTSHEYFATLSDKFDFQTVEKDSADFYVSIEWSNKLKITIYDMQIDELPNNNDCLFSIHVSPDFGDWGLNVDEIQVDCFSSRPLSYTLAWKSIENELIRNNIKADLVQLCGYYQYTPKIKCALIHADDNEQISFLANVVNGNVTRRMISVNSLADQWNISADEVLDYAQQMRRLGYEIRNSSTNPQIKQDQWLIPYAFPTLTPKSVQLHKSLAR